MVDDTTPGLNEFDTGFEKERTERIADRGTDILEQEERRIDPVTGTIEIDRTRNPICSCGAPYHTTGQFYRCAECNAPSCPRCIIPLQRRHYCPDCVERAYSMDRRVFWFLLYIKHDQLEADDLIEVDAVADGTEVTVDRAATTLSDHGYITDTGDDLTPSGTEALAAGKKLYGDDPDVASTLEKLRVREVANNEPT